MRLAAVQALYYLLEPVFGRLLGENGNFTYLKVSIKVHYFQYHVKKYTPHYKSSVPLAASTCLNCKLITFLSRPSETLRGTKILVSKLGFFLVSA